DLDQGKYRDSDHYICHEFMMEKNVLVITDRHVLLTHKRDILGVWVSDEALSYDEIKPPQKRELIIRLELKQKKPGIFGIGKDKGKDLKFKDRQTCEKIFMSISRAYEESANI
uniref:Intermembrane lipid transfer protein VPS13-like C-terminal domain-containing protein n=1 Tax=Acrobeloides nanus TaxID=290746 RepID=A0A914CX84_9BILA